MMERKRISREEAEKMWPNKGNDMSGECDMCGHHCTECSCPEKPDYCSPTDLRDRCNVIRDLLTLLLILLENQEYRNHVGCPHMTLVLDIKEKVEFIEQKLQEL